jgi:hypothetical protein
MLEWRRSRIRELFEGRHYAHALIFTVRLALG